MNASTLVGRDTLLEIARSALDRPGRVLLEGPAGIGKTSLLRALVEDAADRTMTVLRCGPTETESALPLAALADLLAPLADDVAALQAPQRDSVRSVLLVEDAAQAVDERALAAATGTLIERAADRNPAGVLLAVDDAPWLDPPSERALRFVLRRSSTRVRVVVTRRIDEQADPPVPLGLDTAAAVERLTLTPLGVGALHHLLANRFGVSLSRPLAARLARESGGNPLLAIELTRAMLRLPQLPGPGSDLPVPASMHALVDATLAALDPDLVHAARVAALLSAPRARDLAAAGVGPAAIDAIEEAGLVSVDGALRVRFVHPVLATAVRAGIPTGVRRRLHVALAEAAADPDERARQLSQATVEADNRIAGELADAAARARARGAPELAAEFYDRAAALGTDPLQVTTRRLLAVHCLFDSGDYTRAAQQADALAGALDGDALAEALLLRASIAFSVDDLPLAAATADRALAAAQPGSRLAGRVHAHLAIFVDQAGPARAHAEAALDLLPFVHTESVQASLMPGPPTGFLGRTDDALLASVLMLVFLNEVRAGEPARETVLERALEMEQGTPSWLAGTIPAIWWSGIDRHDRARDRLMWMLELAEASGDEPQQHELMEHLAQAETTAGNYARAAAWVGRASELATQMGAGVAAERWLAGMLDVHRGDLEAARLAGEAGLAESDGQDDSWLRRISLQLLAFAALADGRAVDAAATYRKLAQTIDAGGLVESLSSRFEPDWVEACVGAGDLATAETALHRLADRHARLPRPWTTLALARSRVLIDATAGRDTAAGVDALLVARDLVPPDVVPFDRARCLYVAGLVHRRARRRLAAREALLSAAAEFDALGAPTFAARARADAERTGARSGGSAELTSSEQRVAELAAGGATNREIAEALFVSPKTVEANLSRAYRKLGISRRVELAAALVQQRRTRRKGHAAEEE